MSKVTWLHNNLFYTLSSKTRVGDSLLFVRQGANDPVFNLRREPGIIIRKSNARDAIFVNIIESHGTYDAVTERAENTESIIDKIDIIQNTDTYTALEITYKDGNSNLLIISNLKADSSEKHSLTLNGTSYSWEGPYYFINR